MNRDHRTIFMKMVREALGHPGNRRRQAPPGLFPNAPSAKSLERLKRIDARAPTERRVLIDTLRRAAEPINLEVVVAPSAEAAAAVIVDTVGSSPTEWGGSRKVCAWDHPLIDSLGLAAALARQEIPLVTVGSLFPAAGEGLTGDQRSAWRRAVIDCFVGITAADFCVADTATLVLRTRPGLPRGVSLVPSIHIAVITVDRILADLKELYAVLRWGDAPSPADLTTCMTFISGPSKTADIEATLVHGAHGPKRACLFVIAET
jgi:L-lactate dehydrogenase complex protein LldG